jgi:CHAT domain-containing protein
LGEAYAWLNQPDKATELYEQALAIHREVKSREFEGATLLRMGQLKQKMRRTDEAVGLITESVAVFHSIGDRNQEFGALTALAKAERERGNLRRALTHVEESLRIAESLRTESVSPESRASFLAAVQESYQVHTDLLMRQHRAEPAKGFDVLAIEVGERQRARSLLDTLIEARADLRQGVAPALIEREHSLAKQLNDKAQTQASTPEQAAALKREISQLETDYERAKVAIRKANPHYAALTQPQPLKLREIQQQLDADTLLLEYSLGEERSYLWAITKDSLTSYELPKGELIEKTARQIYELLTARSTTKHGESALQRQERIRQAEANLPAAAQSLSQTLLAPAAAQLANKRLVIVADGALQYIPFAMLPDPAANTPSAGSRSSVIGKNQPLVINHEIVSLPSASALAIQRAEFAGRKPASKTLAVIADPVFDRTDARLSRPATEVNEKQQAQTIAFDDARSIEHLAGKSDDKAGATTRRMIIPRLPFTRQEATRLLALAPKQSSFGAIDFQASRETVLKGDLSQYRYLHFATHGLLDSERPGLSALVLSMVDEQGNAQDGFLRANDIYNLKLPAELVVLSACQTGLGKEIKGEGLVGLTRGFMYAGAARVVVSLWSVNDKATAELMAKFYQKMLKQGERPAAALRAAQVEMRRQKQWQSPYYWAAFTLQGEWR